MGISLTIFDEDVLENMRDCITHILPNAGVFIEEYVEMFSTDELLEIEELAKKGLVESVNYFGGNAEVNLVTGGIIEIMGDETDKDWFFVKALFSNFVAFGELKGELTLLSRWN